MEKIEKIVQKAQKTSVFLTSLGFSYNNINKLIRNKDIRVDGQKISSDIFLSEGQSVTIFTPILPQKRFEILFQDENILVLNKKSGIEVEGPDGLEGETGCIAVHRIDRNTEGLLIMAKNKESEDILLRGIKNRAIDKKYIAEVVGKVNFNNQKITGFLVKDGKNSSVKVYDRFVQGSVKIETIFDTLKIGNETTIVEATLITGKTHQIRAQLAYIGHAIVGDGKYGKNQDNKKFKEKSQKLHCYYLRINNLTEKLSYLNGREFICYPNWFKK